MKTQKVILSYLKRATEDPLPLSENIVETSMALHKLKKALKDNESYENLNKVSLSSAESREHSKEQEELESLIKKKTQELKGFISKLR